MRYNNFQQTRQGLHFLCNTENGIPVFDRANSHFSDHGFSEDTMKKAISMITQTSQFEKHVVNMGRVVGVSNCVAVTDEDQVVMAVRKKRFGPTPMVIGREPEPCSSVVVILKKATDYDGDYFVLITAFVGEGSEPEPWDRQLRPGTPEHERSVAFWQTHALLYDEEVIEYVL